MDWLNGLIDWIECVDGWIDVAFGRVRRGFFYAPIKIAEVMDERSVLSYYPHQRVAQQIRRVKYSSTLHAPA